MHMQLMFPSERVMNCAAWKNYIMTEKLDLLFGTKILNRQTNEIGVLIKTWKNKFADESIWFATCVDKTGKRYNVKLDEIVPMEEVNDS